MTLRSRTIRIWFLQVQSLIRFSFFEQTLLKLVKFFVFKVEPSVQSVKIISHKEKHELKLLVISWLIWQHFNGNYINNYWPLILFTGEPRNFFDCWRWLSTMKFSMWACVASDYFKKRAQLKLKSVLCVDRKAFQKRKISQCRYKSKTLNKL